MENVRKFDFKAFLEQAPQRNLQQAARAHLHTAIRLYLKIEGARGARGQARGQTFISRLSFNIVVR
jgi:hypothetical protein